MAPSTPLSSPSLRAIRTWREAVRVFSTRPSPRLVAAALAGGVLHRARAGRAGRGDVVAAGVVLASRGLHEYVIHRWLLHAPRRQVRGLVIDPGTGHRAHHARPDVVRDAFIPPLRAVAFVVLLGAYVAAIGRLLRVPVRARRTATVTAWAALLAYEWRHFLDHTSVPLRSRRARALRTHHRAHHHVDERRDLGITSRAGDAVAGRVRDLLSRRSSPPVGVRR